MSKKKEQAPAPQVDTTGHTWDGIEELNNPLPRWWLWCFYLTIIWGVGYTIAYPAWPLINGATGGMLGYSTRAEVAEAIETHEARNADLVAQLVDADMATLTEEPDLLRYATARGASVFRAQCSQCHGSGAAGAVGYPNLLDDDWLWGGDMETITYTIRHGIRNETDFDAQYSEMPAFGDLLEVAEIAQSVQYVMALSGQDHDAELAAAGQTVFMDNCAACHGDAGLGDASLGAPNLSDAIWLYGGSRDAIEHSVVNARFGVMPAWGQRLNEEDVRAVAAYVHQLGGGE